MIVQTVGLGHLATVLPRSIAETQPGLHWLPLLPELPNHTIALISHRGAYKSAACMAFEELAAEWSLARTEEGGNKITQADPIRRSGPQARNAK